jgi:hypothetical protein
LLDRVGDGSFATQKIDQYVMGAQGCQRRDGAATRLVEAARLPFEYHLAQCRDGAVAASNSFDHTRVAIVE